MRVRGIAYPSYVFVLMYTCYLRDSSLERCSWVYASSTFPVLLDGLQCKVHIVRNCTYVAVYVLWHCTVYVKLCFVYTRQTWRKKFHNVHTYTDKHVPYVRIYIIHLRTTVYVPQAFREVIMIHRGKGIFQKSRNSMVIIVKLCMVVFYILYYPKITSFLGKVFWQEVSSEYVH